MLWWGGVERQMGRKVLRPNSDNLVELIDENLPPEVKIEFIQKLLHVDSPEIGAQKLLGVGSPEEMVLKLTKTKEQQKQLLGFLRRNLEENEE